MSEATLKGSSWLHHRYRNSNNNRLHHRPQHFELAAMKATQRARPPPPSSCRTLASYPIISTLPQPPLEHQPTHDHPKNKQMQDYQLQDADHDASSHHPHQGPQRLDIKSWEATDLGNCPKRESPKAVRRGCTRPCDPGSRGPQRVFCTTQNLFCTGAAPFRTNAKCFLFAGSKWAVAPSPNHFWEFPHWAISQVRGFPNQESSMPADQVSPM